MHAWPGKRSRVVLEMDAAIDTVWHPIGSTTLLLASRRGHVHVASRLLRKRAGLHLLDGDGRSALMITSISGQLGIVCLLLEHRADTWSWDQEGIAALMLACAGGNIDIARELLVARADASAWDKRGTTTLILTAESGRWLGPYLDADFIEGHSNLSLWSVQVCCFGVLLRLMTGTTGVEAP